MDWSTREATEQLRVEREAAIAREESVRKARLKDVCGKELFEQLHAWLVKQAESYNKQVRKQAIKVDDIELVGGIDNHYFFQVSDFTSGTRLPMKVVYNPTTHVITVECGAGRRQYSLVIGPDDNAFFETPRHEPLTIAQLGEHLMDHWRSSQF